MAAFERISNVEVQSLPTQPQEESNKEQKTISEINALHSSTSFIIDIRTAKLPFKRPPNDEFEPRDHRNPPNPISPAMAYFNMLRIVFGPGFLTLPLALSQAGIVVGPILLICIGLLLMHMHLILLWCLNEVSRQMRIPWISYRYGFRMALLHGPPLFHGLGERGPRLVATCMDLSQIGICSVFIVFTSDSLRDIMDWDSSTPAIFSLFIPYMLLAYFTKNLKIISYISLIGNFINLTGLILVFYHIFKDSQGGSTVLQMPDALQFLYAVGLGYFNMSSLGVTLTLEKALKNPKIMNGRYGVVSVGMMVPTILGVTFSMLGLRAFGVMDDNILRSLPCDETTTMISQGLYLVAVAFAYPIQGFPAMEIITDVVQKHDPKVTPSKQTVKLVEMISRPLFVIVTFLIAYLIPFQGAIVSYVGNLSTSVLSVVLPALMEICILYPDGYGKYSWRLWKDIIFIIIGLCSCVFGALFCTYLIYKLLLMKQASVGEEYNV